MLADVDVDKLVWDDAHALEGESLDLGPWEALADPTLALLLIHVDLLLNEVNNDLIVNYRKQPMVRAETRNRYVGGYLPNWKFLKHSEILSACGPLAATWSRKIFPVEIFFQSK